MSHENRNEDRLLSPKEASRLAGVSKKTLVRWEEDGLIECIRNGPNGHRRYWEGDIVNLGHGDDYAHNSGAENANDRDYGNGNDDRGNARFNQGYSNRQPSPWDEEVKNARSRLELERLNEEKRRLVETRRREQVEQARHTADLKHKEDERQWIGDIKRDALRLLEEPHYISGVGRFLQPPADVVARATKQLNSVINSSTCSLPNDGVYRFLRSTREHTLAKQTVSSIIDEWKKAEKQKYEAASQAQQPNGWSSSAAQSNNDNDEDDWDDEYDDEDEYDD
jgi:DNA-binding transcriptional MerR regulator